MLQCGGCVGYYDIDWGLNWWGNYRNSMMLQHKIVNKLRLLVSFTFQIFFQSYPKYLFFHNEYLVHIVWNIILIFYSQHTEVDVIYSHQKHLEQNMKWYFEGIISSPSSHVKIRLIKNFYMFQWILFISLTDRQYFWVFHFVFYFHSGNVAISGYFIEISFGNDTK